MHSWNQSGGQDGALEHQGLRFARFFDGFAQDALGAGMAFTAVCTDFEMQAHFQHGVHAGIDRLPDLSVGDIIAYTYNHSCTLLRRSRKEGIAITQSGSACFAESGEAGKPGRHA